MEPMTAWVDSHNHLHDPRLGEVAGLVAAMRGAGVGACVANATGEEDWPAVLGLARDFPGFARAALGVHPWRAAEARPGWPRRLAELLEAHPAASVGECGLDGWVASPSPAVQEPVFLGQIRLARELDRPLTIHCLKAWEGLFAAFKREPPPSRFLMHSFGGSIELAARLVPLGAYFSFSGYFLTPRKAKTVEVFRRLPRERLLLESDAPDMAPPPPRIRHPLAGGLNHPANLPSIGEGLAQALGMEPAALAALCSENHRRCFEG